MSYDEYKQQIETMVKEPDTFATNALNLLENLKSDLDTLNSLADQLTAQEDKIRSLQDTNTQLFLRLTTNPAPEIEDKKIDIDTIMKEQFEGGKAI